MVESSDVHITIDFTMKNGSVQPIVLCKDKVLGKGSFGTVTRGYNESTKQEYAIKTIKAKKLITE